MKKWITLIELLIAIIVFWIWVLYIISTIIWNVRYVTQVNLKTQATFLAKEWIEMVYNLVDTNISKWINWNCSDLDIDYVCTDFIWNTNNFYKISYITWSSYLISPTVDDFNDNVLFFHTWDVNWFEWFWFDHNSSWEETVFSRYLYFTWIYSEPDWGILDKNKILKVSSYVEYRMGVNTWSVVIESFIWKTR